MKFQLLPFWSSPHPTVRAVSKRLGGFLTVNHCKPTHVAAFKHKYFHNYTPYGLFYFVPKVYYWIKKTDCDILFHLIYYTHHSLKGMDEDTIYNLKALDKYLKKIMKHSDHLLTAT